MASDRQRGGAYTLTHRGKVVTVLRVQWQADDAQPLATMPVVIGRAIVDTAEGGRFHAIIITWDDVVLDVPARGHQREQRVQKTGAMFWNRETNGFEIVELP